MILVRRQKVQTARNEILRYYEPRSLACPYHKQRGINMAPRNSANVIR